MAYVIPNQELPEYPQHIHNTDTQKGIKKSLNKIIKKIFLYPF